MLHNIKELYGNALAAKDGAIGQVKDFYFDDQAWVVRYLVADTGTWLTDNLVLLSPHSFGKWDRDLKSLQINLTRKQIEESPSITSHLPVSRRYEEDYYRYYGWSGYWQGGEMWGMSGFPVMAMPVPAVESSPELRPDHHESQDPHLRSAKDMLGYHMQATDGAIGTVRGLMVDDKSWEVAQVVVETGPWYADVEIMIPPAKIQRISHEESKIYVNLPMEEIKRTLDHAVAGG